MKILSVLSKFPNFFCRKLKKQVSWRGVVIANCCVVIGIRTKSITKVRFCRPLEVNYESALLSPSPSMS